MSISSSRSPSRSLALVFIAAVLSFARADVASADMQGDVDQAVDILTRFQQIPEGSIPPSVMKDAKGVAIITVLKAGFGFSARGGTGVVVARTDDGWSGPSAIGTGGAGFGFQIGAKVSEFIYVLNTAAAVKAFSHGGNVQVGGAISAAAGPFGRDAEAGVTPMAAIYTYSRSQGVFGGVSVEGTVIAERTKTNKEYYGKDVTPSEILDGNVEPPPGAAKLRGVLDQY